MAQPETSNVVGVFDDYSAAERAARELADNGVPRQSIQIQSNFMTGAAGRSEHPDADSAHEGGISGFFRRLFGSDEPDEYAGHYAEAVRRGSAVLCAPVPAQDVERVAAIMNDNGAVDIDRRVGAYRQSGYETYDPEASPYSHDESVQERERFSDAERGASIPVVEEELQVGKRPVVRGGVRIYSRMVERPVEEDITLREEHVRVERRPVDRPMNPSDVSRLRDQSVEVTETAEEPVVSKRARVKEEVIVGKETTERTERIRENVRHTEVNVDDLRDERAGAADFRRDFRNDYEKNYAQSGIAYETVEPAYEYGYRMANDPRYRGRRQWSTVERDLESDYLRNRPDSVWDRIKGAVRYGWEKATGKPS
jgi:uncharacterized protein (TIGR02271 family)